MRWVVVAACVAWMGLTQIAQAQSLSPDSPPNPDAPVYVVTYLDILPPAKNAAIALLKQVRDACRKEDGNVRCEFVQRMERQNQFALLEVWQNQKAYAAHGSAPATVQWRDKLKPSLNSPIDERVHTAFSVQPPQLPPSGRIVYVVTHVDAIPPRAGDAATALTNMAEAGRRDPGAGRLEVLQQLAPKTDHFTLIEIWTNRKVLEAHQMTPGYIQYRDALQPALGALYDERLFKLPD